MFEGFVVNVLAEASKNPDVQKFIEGLLSQAIKELKAGLMPDLIGLLPVFAASVVKAAFDKIPNLPDLGDVAGLTTDVVKNVLDSDPDIPGLSNIFDLSEILRGFLPR